MRIGILVLLLMAGAADAAGGGKSAPLAAGPSPASASNGFTRGVAAARPDPARRGAARSETQDQRAGLLQAGRLFSGQHQMQIRAWLAIVAMALNALWPLIAQAKPSLLVPVCTVGGTTHYVEIPGGTTPVDSQHEHCAFCFAGAALPAKHVRHGVDALSFTRSESRFIHPSQFHPRQCGRASAAGSPVGSIQQRIRENK